ncbi:Ankyrin repeat-containing protein ITN1 [Camellia lanceoleosa]|uniref:Ankyrin repeat-containing protein ITN1 n=1 Tax=Camellia lanceoleosa TaxID=1840588 RepID=A0ACC0GE29_9ERIC|nr:Ankyrin repeat-containing protein ITN1 [Camellia lanceoleosa]
MATHGKQEELVLSLLREVPETENHMLAGKNDVGNTILHDAATSNKLILTAREMLRRVPALLHEHNRSGETALARAARSGETALARAARYGKMEMFKFLDGEVKRTFTSDGKEEDGEEGHIGFYRRDDKSTILHGAVYSEHFGVSTEEASTTEAVPLWEAIRGKNQKYQSAVRLAKFLIERDTSWEATETVLDMGISKTHKYGVASISSVQLRVKKISTIHFTRHLNKKGQTADRLFAENNIKHRTEAKEWLKRTSENCSIVTVLISTVAFAAAYTVPGGPNQSTGYPLLLNQPFFVIFALTGVLSLTFALTSVITFLSILTSSFRLSDFKQSLPQKLMLGITLLILSVSMMMLAFAATVILLIRNKQEWTRIALYSMAFFPVSIFALTYLPIYTQLMKSFAYTLKKIGVAPSLFNGGILRSWVAKSFKSGRKSKASNSSALQISHDHV